MVPLFWQCIRWHSPGCHTSDGEQGPLIKQNDLKEIATYEKHGQKTKAFDS